MIFFKHKKKSNKKMLFNIKNIKIMCKSGGVATRLRQKASGRNER